MVEGSPSQPRRAPSGVRADRSEHAMAIPRRVVRGVASLGALPLVAALAVVAAAQPAPVQVHILRGPGGTLYVVQGDTSWTLAPGDISADQEGALNPIGEIDEVLPDQLFVPSAPTPTAPPAPSATQQLAATPIPQPTVAGTWVGRLDQTAGGSFTITLTVQVSGGNATGTWRATTLDGQSWIVRNLVGTFSNNVLQVRHTTTADQSPGSSGWCPPNNAVDTLTLSQNRLDGTQDGACGSGVVHLTKAPS